MKYLVMENHAGHSIVMDEEGSFHRVANLGYEIGDTIYDPIFMKTPEAERKSVSWKKISTIAAIFICLLLTSIPFINNGSNGDVVVHMSINPEIHLELKNDGKISRIAADNEDGEILLDGYRHKGKSASSVLMELIDRAEELEFLSEGGNIQITVEAAEPGKAESVSVDLSQFLSSKYLKKYLIKIRINKGDFCNIENVAATREMAASYETEQMTEADMSMNSTGGANSYSREELASKEYADNTVPTPDDASEEESYTANSISAETDRYKDDTAEGITVNTVSPTEIPSSVKPTEQKVETTEATNATSATGTSAAPEKPTQQPTGTTESSAAVTEPSSQPTQETTQNVTSENPSEEMTSGSSENDQNKDDEEDDKPVWPWWPWWPWPFED